MPDKTLREIAEILWPMEEFPILTATDCPDSCLGSIVTSEGSAERGKE
jgi:hypothetical protein